MELLLPGRFNDPGTAYAYQRTIFEEVAAGERPPTVSITPSTHHVGVTRRDTLRPGFGEAVRAAYGEGYPVLVRGAGGGATAASEGTFGFSIIRPAGDTRRGIGERSDEARKRRQPASRRERGGAEGCNTCLRRRGEAAVRSGPDTPRRADVVAGP